MLSYPQRVFQPCPSFEPTVLQQFSNPLQSKSHKCTRATLISPREHAELLDQDHLPRASSRVQHADQQVEREEVVGEPLQTALFRSLFLPTHSLHPGRLHAGAHVAGGRSQEPHQLVHGDSHQPEHHRLGDHGGDPPPPPKTHP